MTQLTDILSVPALREQVEAGNVRVQTHPDFPHLFIANYTEQAAFNREWNDITRICRGLIWNDETGEVLARPFPKFHNFDEKEAPRILDDQIVYAWDNKYDGSLGIVYHNPNGDLSIATRGSFASDQAKLGAALLRELSWDTLEMLHEMIEAGFTPLYEICGPDNRIVLKYEANFVALLGFMNIADGWFQPANPQHDKRDMRSLLIDLSRSNAEGWVVWKTAYEAVKIKQADYIELHRIVTNLSEKEVWRQLRAGTFYDFIIALPDEWHDWARNIANGLRDQFILAYNEADAKMFEMKKATGKAASRKDQALWLQSNASPTVRGLVFNLLDDKDIADPIWRQLEPKGE